MSAQAAEASERISVKEAILFAKTQVKDLLDGEEFSQLGLEEVRYDDKQNEWLVTLGFNRPWNVEKQVQQTSFSAAVYGSVPSTTTRQIRTYKKVRLDGRTGNLVAIEGKDD